MRPPLPIVVARRERQIGGNPEETAHALSPQFLERDAVVRRHMREAVWCQLLAHLLLVRELNLLAKAEAPLVTRRPEALDGANSLDSAHLPHHLSRPVHVCDGYNACNGALLAPPPAACPRGTATGGARGWSEATGWQAGL